MITDLTQLKDFTLALAEQAGSLLLQYRTKPDLAINKKSWRSLVSEADLAAEKLIVEAILSRYPNHSVLSEEGSPVLKSSEEILKPLWIIDPLDGTTNFARGHSHFCVSIAYAEQGEVQLGVVFAPVLSELFYAVRGQGAYLNSKPISVSSRDSLKEAVVSTGFPYIREGIKGLMMQNLEFLMQNCMGIRRAGAAAIDLAWVACGRLEAHYELKLNPWDVAAGGLLIREAGGVFGSVGPYPANCLATELYADEVLAGNTKVVEELKKGLKEHI